MTAATWCLYWLVVVLLTFLCPVQGLDTNQAFEAFQKWTLKYRKFYTSMEEHASRFEVFVQSLERIAQRNKDHGPDVEGNMVFGLNKYSDLTPDEFRKLFLHYQPNGSPVTLPFEPEPAFVRSTTNTTDLPLLGPKDWRDDGAVTPVSQQGSCGGCFAFSVAHEMESMNYLHGGKSLTPLSVQQIISCDEYDGGCNGGDTLTAYKYVHETGGLTTASRYPYESLYGHTPQCDYDGSVYATLSKTQWVTPPCYDSCTNQNERVMMDNIATVGPASVCVYADVWHDYSGGIMNSGCLQSYYDMNHCVQVVGFSHTSTVWYWLVRNTWGSDWGIDGYIHLQIGNNVCGVANQATFAYP